MPRPALTLIEVLVSLVILETSASLLLQAQSRSLAQLVTLRQRETAHGIAHELIAGWRSQTRREVTTSQGSWDADPSWHWVRKTEPSSLIHRTPVQQVMLSIYYKSRLIREETWLERIDEPTPSTG